MIVSFDTIGKTITISAYNVEVSCGAGLGRHSRGPQARAFCSKFKFKDTYGKRFNETRATYGCGPEGSRQRLSIPPLRDSVLTAGGIETPQPLERHSH